MITERAFELASPGSSAPADRPSLGAARASGRRSGAARGAQDAELDFDDLMVRLRRYVGSRARRDDPARRQEGEALLTELLDALKRLRAAAAARATRRSAEITPS